MSDPPASESNFAIDVHDYRVTLAGALRKPPPRIGAPALIWHFSLWCPPIDEGHSSVAADSQKIGQKTATDNPQRLSPQEHWHKAIDHFLFTLFAKLKSDPGFNEPTTTTPNYDHKTDTLYLFRHFVSQHSTKPILYDKDFEVIKPENRSALYDVFSVRTTFRDLHLLVRAELYSEFWNMDFICDFDKVKPGHLADVGSTLHIYDADIKEIYNFIRDQLSQHIGKDCVERITKEEIKKLQDIRRTLHKRFRSVIHDYLLKPCFTSVENRHLGAKFAEFHGSIFGLRPTLTQTEQNESAEPREAKPLILDLNAIHVGSSPSEIKRTIQNQVGTYVFKDEVGLSVVDAMWPFIREIQRSSDDEERKEQQYGKPEFTVSFMQDKRSIYISSLGWLDPQLESRECKPIVYTIVVSYHSSWALGRLVERINNMGSFRLAALRDIEKISQVGDELKRIEEELRREERNSLNGNPINGKLFADKCLKAGSAITYGLMHRVERSQYYVNEFERCLGNLRCDRIEGFQPYNEFVRRRMYGAFDYIRRIGNRYSELRREIDLILRNSRVPIFIMMPGEIRACLLCPGERR